VTPDYQSASTRLFRESAEELAVRLEEEGSETAGLLAAEARQLVQRFVEWQTVRPTDEERVATIQRLFELNRRAADYLAA
jgi:hypothetical protein